MKSSKTIVVIIKAALPNASSASFPRSKTIVVIIKENRLQNE